MSNTAALPDSADVVIVGAGLAGLVAAKVLEQHNLNTIVLEESDGVGGRVRTDHVDGFLLDRGFQVLLTAYPELPRHLNLGALDLQLFEPGAIVWRDGKGTVVGDPIRRPKTVMSTALAQLEQSVTRLGSHYCAVDCCAPNPVLYCVETIYPQHRHFVLRDFLLKSLSVSFGH